MKLNKKGFTFAELLLAMSFVIVITPILYWFLVDFSNKIYLSDIKTKSMSNLIVTQNTLAWIVGDSYWLDYGNSSFSDELDKLTIYTDKLERNTLSIYVKQDLDYDISRLYIEENWVETPLHSTELFIESFNVNSSPEPFWNFQDVQPWVSFDIEARTRSPLEIPTDDKYYESYNKSEISLNSGKRVIRNFVPSSWRN